MEEQPENVRDAADRLTEAVRGFERTVGACDPEAFRTCEVKDSVRAAVVLVDAAEFALNDPDGGRADLVAVLRVAARAVRQSRDRVIDAVVTAAAVPDHPGAIG
ncbi:hypothetical protein [Kitasatospora griseola]|uniref:hypothetical protein n=1 Tax=Kitasatospora griseola TaxID=2064 RepID=UPI00167186BD|nr:hypothetical protein [Kitasatospora griseola]